MVTHSSTIAWKTPWMEEPGRLQFMGSHRVRHDWVIELNWTNKCVCVCVCVLVAQSCLTLYDPMDCSRPCSCIHGILQARRVEWVVIPFSRGSSHSKDQTWVSCIAGGFFIIWATREAWEKDYFMVFRLPSWRRVRINSPPFWKPVGLNFPYTYHLPSSSFNRIVC